jgi:hypothetical protein
MFFEPIYGGLAASRALGMFRDFVVAGLGFREGGFIIGGTPGGMGMLLRLMPV